MNVDYEIKPVATEKDQIKHPALAEAGVIPKLNTSNIICGKSGSGKSVLLVNLMTRKEFYQGAFDRVILVSPTGETDDVQKALRIKPSLVFTDLTESIEVLGTIEKVQEALIKEKGASAAPKICVILDDCVGDNNFMKSKQFTNLFIKSRHYNVTVFFLTQHFKRLPRIARLQASTLFFYAISNTEAECLADEFAPPGVSKKSFLRLIDDALQEPYAFLCVNMREPWATRFRSGLAMVIDLNKYRDGSSVRTTSGEPPGQAQRQTGSVPARLIGEGATRSNVAGQGVRDQPGTGQRGAADSRTT